MTIVPATSATPTNLQIPGQARDDEPSRQAIFVPPIRHPGERRDLPTVEAHALIRDSVERRPLVVQQALGRDPGDPQGDRQLVHGSATGHVRPAAGRDQ